MGRKRQKNKSMSDLMPLDLNTAGPVQDDDLVLNEIVFDESLAEKIINYNNNITDFHEDYINFKPNGYGILLRAYCKELQIDENGVVEPNRQVVGIPTKANPNGAAFYEAITDPYGYIRKCVVVSVSDELKDKYEVGDVVYLGNTLKAMPMGAGGDVRVYVEGSFVHPVSGPMEAPTDPENPHFGYILQYDTAIQGADRRDNKKG